MKKIIVSIVIAVVVSSLLLSCTGSSIDLVNRINNAKAQNDFDKIDSLLNELKLVDESAYNEELTYLSIYVERLFNEFIDTANYDHLIGYIEHVQSVFPVIKDEDFKKFASRSVDRLTLFEHFHEIKYVIDAVQTTYPIFDEVFVEEVNRVPEPPSHNVINELQYENFRLILTSEDTAYIKYQDDSGKYSQPLDFEIGDYQFEIWSETLYGVSSVPETISVTISESDNLDNLYPYASFYNLANFYADSPKESVKIFDVIHDLWVKENILYTTNLLNEDVVVDVFLAGLKVASQIMPAKGQCEIELPFMGTDYEIYVRKDNKFYLSSMKASTGISEEQSRRGLFFSTDLENLETTWAAYFNIITNDLNVDVDSTRINGVNVRFVYNEDLLPVESVEFQNIKYQLLTNFHRTSQLMGGYPYSDYIIALVNENVTSSNLRFPSMYGVIYSYDYLLLNSTPENFSEGIVRSWLPFMTMNTNDVSVRWIWEGLTQLIATSLSDKSDVEFLLDPIYSTEKSLDGNWPGELRRLDTDLKEFISMKSQVIHRLMINEYLKDEEHTVEDYFKSFYLGLVVNHPKFDRRDVTTLPLELTINDFKNHFISLIGDEAYVNEIFDKYVTGSEIGEYPEDVFMTKNLPSYFPIWPNEDTYIEAYDENLPAYINELSIPFIE